MILEEKEVKVNLLLCNITVLAICLFLKQMCEDHKSLRSARLVKQFINSGSKVK